MNGQFRAGRLPGEKFRTDLGSTLHGKLREVWSAESNRQGVSFRAVFRILPSGCGRPEEFKLEGCEGDRRMAKLRLSEMRTALRRMKCNGLPDHVIIRVLDLIAAGRDASVEECRPVFDDPAFDAVFANILSESSSELPIDETRILNELAQLRNAVEKLTAGMILLLELQQEKMK
jgi:hypothetical protein